MSTLIIEEIHGEVIVKDIWGVTDLTPVAGDIDVGETGKKKKKRAKKKDVKDVKASNIQNKPGPLDKGLRDGNRGW